MLYIFSHCKFSLLVYIRNGKEITKIMFYFLDPYQMLNSQSSNTTRGKSLYRTVIPFGNSVKIKLENLPLNSPKFIW